MMLVMLVTAAPFYYFNYTGAPPDLLTTSLGGVVAWEAGVWLTHGLMRGAPWWLLLTSIE